jgi:hypothetical protein
MLNCVAARIQRWYLRKSVPGQSSGFRALELIKTMVSTLAKMKLSEAFQT